jgi:guanylate kinase
MPQSLFIISGPSGAGEDSIINGLQEFFPIERVVTTTTRDKRVGESNGNPYYFVSRGEFEQGIAQGKFFEYAEQYNNNLYGVTFEEIERVRTCGKVGVWKIDYKGVETAKKLIPGIPAILISASLEVLELRIRRRDQVTDEFVAERMVYSREWLENHTKSYDYVVENEQGKLDEAIAKVRAIIAGQFLSS